LCKFLRESSPAIIEAAAPPLPQVPTWAAIYPSITRYPSVLQALLAPAARPEDYYQSLVAAARDAGLADPQVLLGLLWHAPLGESGHLPQRWEYFQRLVQGDGEGEGENHLPEAQPRTKGLSPPRGAQEIAPAQNTEPASQETHRDQPPEAGFPSPAAGSAPPAPGTQMRREEGRRGKGNGRVRLPGDEEYFDSWAELFRLSQDNLVVDRRRYEAMIYELGKLGAWQEFFKGQKRENRNLREKIESQWSKELEFFRQLSSKNDKKGWRKW